MMDETAPPPTSRDPSGPQPRSDKEHDAQDSIVESAGDNEDDGRDLVRGDGGSIGLPARPGDLAKDD
ncbi:hypothetical protein [Bradyrhizobium sp. CCH5-F6]|jgi:hypothetical protein|uniref:hypothetical protein n=1 Tax=Bradyrhizobium sp. CCH5-F6 TaxID=1768753 RepID=UPI000AB4FE9E|nr:hypothetical protein [Bradyrhizobium sp. CCH5-F6]